MSIITRRAALGGIALAPTLAVPTALAASTAYAAEFSAEDRARHHLLMAIEAMKEMADAPHKGWNLLAFSHADGSFRGRAIVFDDSPGGSSEIEIFKVLP